MDAGTQGPPVAGPCSPSRGRETGPAAASWRRGRWKKRLHVETRSPPSVGQRARIRWPTHCAGSCRGRRNAPSGNAGVARAFAVPTVPTDVSCNRAPAHDHCNRSVALDPENQLSPSIRHCSTNQQTHWSLTRKSPRRRSDMPPPPDCRPYPLQALLPTFACRHAPAR